jgi:RecJ-like exonuclease
MQLEIKLWRACCDIDEPTVTVVRYINRNGSEALVPRCVKCGTIHRGNPIARESIRKLFSDEQFANIPVAGNESCRNCHGHGCEWCSVPCDVCGGHTRVEQHHWWPRAMQTRNTHEGWIDLTSPLCRQCHEDWHNTITPTLMRKNRP